MEQGYTAYKWSPKQGELTPAYIEEVRETGHRLREIMGRDNGISVDLGNVQHMATAISYA